VSLMSHRGVSMEEIARLVGRAATRTTEVAYRWDLRPVITTGADIMDEIFKRKLNRSERPSNAPSPTGLWRRSLAAVGGPITKDSCRWPTSRPAPQAAIARCCGRRARWRRCVVVVGGLVAVQDAVEADRGVPEGRQCEDDQQVGGG